MFWKETSVTMTSWSYLSWWYWKSFRYLLGFEVTVLQFLHLSSFNSSSLLTGQPWGGDPLLPRMLSGWARGLGNEMKGESLSVWASMIRYLSCLSLLRCSLEPVLPSTWVPLAASLFQLDWNIWELLPVALAILSGMSSLNSSFPLKTWFKTSLPATSLVPISCLHLVSPSRFSCAWLFLPFCIAQLVFNLFIMLMHLLPLRAC